MFNLISAFSFSDFWVKAWDALTSKTALIVYAAIILVLILALVVRVALNEQKRVAEIKANDERRQEVHENEQLEAVKSELDKKMNKISSDVAAVKNSIASPSAPVFRVRNSVVTARQRSCGRRPRGRGREHWRVAVLYAYGNRQRVCKIRPPRLRR